MRTVFDLDRDSLLSDRENEIDLGLGPPLGEMGDVEIGQRAEEVSDGALVDPPGQIAQVRVLFQAV